MKWEQLPQATSCRSGRSWPRAAVPNVRAKQTTDKLRISATGCFVASAPQAAVGQKETIEYFPNSGHSITLLGSPEASLRQQPTNTDSWARDALKCHSWLRVKASRVHWRHRSVLLCDAALDSTFRGGLFHAMTPVYSGGFNPQPGVTLKRIAGP